MYHPVLIVRLPPSFINLFLCMEERAGESILPQMSIDKSNYFQCIQVATALLVAGLTLTFWIPGQISLHPLAHIQALFKGARLLI